MVYPITGPGLAPEEAEVFRTSVSGDGRSVDVSLVYCPECGQELDGAWAFCQRCGTKLADALAGELGRFRCVLVREGRTGPVRVLRDGSAVPAGGIRRMAAVLGRVSDELNGGESRFGTGRDVYVTYRQEDGHASPVKCPLGQRGFCGGDGGRPCADLVGWLCMEDGGTTYVCAGLCSAYGGAEAERRPRQVTTPFTREDIVDILSGTEGGAG